MTVKVIYRLKIKANNILTFNSKLAVA